MLICDISRGFKASKFKKGTADTYMASIEREAEEGPDSYLAAKMYSMKNANDLLAHHLVEYDRAKPPQQALAKLLEVAPPVMNLGGGAAAAAAHAPPPPPWQDSCFVRCHCKTFKGNLLCSHVIAFCHVRGHISLELWEKALPARKPVGRPKKGASSFMQRPGEASEPGPTRKKDPLKYYMSEVDKRNGLAFNGWNAARKNLATKFIEVGKVTGFQPDAPGPFWRVTYPSGEFEDLTKKELAEALTLNSELGGAQV